MPKITPFLWFDSQAEEAARLYVEIFRNSKVGNITRYSEASAKASGRPEGSVMTVEFQIEGQDFVALNGGPLFTFTPAISFMVDSESQEEVDRLWAALTDGGKEEMCGWLQDKFGVSWQIVPRRLNQMLADPDKEKLGRVMDAMLKMKKIDIALLEKAASSSK
jgi:predicted 3-demethylubiquinone-9 3-methyltransferase (glyoxalase superfamily)